MAKTYKGFLGWITAVGFVLWLLLFTRVPCIFPLISLILSGTNESIGQELFREKGPATVMSYNDFQTLIKNSAKCKQALKVAWIEKINKQEALLLEFNDPYQEPKIVFIPSGKSACIDLIDRANVSTDISENGAYRRQMAQMIIQSLIMSPQILFSKH